MVRKPPHILITTPESLYLLLTSRSREALRSVETVIVDEIHALVPTKRGAHLALSLERLEALAGRGPSPHRRLGFRWEKMSALRSGRFKLLRLADGEPWQLYDLAEDPGEQHDVSAGHSDIVNQLAEEFAAWDKEVRQW